MWRAFCSVLPEMTIFCNPLTNSFQRLGEFEAPKYITWSHQNSRPLITVPLSEDSTAHRFKLRAFDGCINPYIVFALLIHAGLDGIEQGLPLPPACDENLFTASPTRYAPVTRLCLALYAMRSASPKDSDFITKLPPEKARTAFFAAKRPNTTASCLLTTARLPNAPSILNATNPT